MEPQQERRLLSMEPQQEQRLLSMEPQQEQRRIKIRGGEEERKIREEYLRYSMLKKLVLSEQQQVQRRRIIRRIREKERGGEGGLSEEEEEEEEEGRELEKRCIIRKRKREREREEEELRKRNLLLLEECVLSDHTAHLLFLLVLYRLPVESIFIFKSVSKSCLAMISHPNFARSYSLLLSRRTRRRFFESPWTLLFRKNSSSSSSGARLPFIITKPVFKAPGFKFRFLSSALKARITPLAVSNGLILTTTTSHGDSYYICNPLTQQWTALPKTPRVHQSVSLGFVVEPYGGNFQLLRIGGFEGKSSILNFEIFSSKTLQWKEKSVSFDHQVTELVCTCHAVTCKQILYWMDCNKVVACDSSQSDNEETIRWWQIDLPSDQVIHGSEIMGMIGVCQDKLHYFHSADGIENISIWELRKYNDEGEGEWILLHRIRYGEVSPAPLRIVQPLAFHPFDLDLVYLYSSGSLASLSLRSKVVKNCLPLEGVVTWWTVLPFVLPTWPTPVPRISPTPV